MHYLVGTDSVHTTAAACDYLAERVTTADTVTFVGVVSPADGVSKLDLEEAMNVARVRLVTAESVETVVTDELGAADDPIATQLCEAVVTHEAGELLIGAHAGRPDASGLGKTATSILENAPCPVVVLPPPEF